MKKNIYIFVGSLVILLVIATLFVFKVFGSESISTVSRCTPYNVLIEKGKEDTEVSISWKSKERCTGYILYGSDMKDLSLVGVDLENDIESKDHIVKMLSLISSKRYYFTIVSDGVSYGKEGLPLQFTINSL